MDKKTVTIKLNLDTVESFVTCLGIGTLEAIRLGIIPAETGTWTLGRPNVWSPLEQNQLVSQGTIEVFQTCDELSAIQTLLPEQFEQEVQKLIERLIAELRQVSDSNWYMRWGDIFDDNAPNDLYKIQA